MESIVTKYLPNIALAIFFLQSTASWALSAEQAKSKADIAKSLSNVGKHSEAYLQLIPVLEEARPEIQRIAIETLETHPSIPNHVLSEISSHTLTVKTCIDGLLYTEIETHRVLRQLNGFADEQISTSASKIVKDFSINARINRLEENCAPIREKEAERIRTIQEEQEENSRAQQKVLEEERARMATHNAPTLAANLGRLDFCVKYGEVLRGNSPVDFGKAQGLPSFFDKEARKRKIRLNRKLVESEKIRIGMTECELYAAWGSPLKINRTIGNWGTHVQYIYGRNGPYVYTENGVVSAFQD
jgi:hypothetical protein